MRETVQMEPMKPPTVASLKKVSPENLARLGAKRLAQILVEVADARPDVKRRLRMELAAEQGADHLTLELDRRLASLETSRSKVPWRRRPSFVADLEGLRALIAERLAELDAPAALSRMLAFMDVARRIGVRVRDDQMRAVPSAEAETSSSPSSDTPASVTQSSWRRSSRVWASVQKNTRLSDTVISRKSSSTRCTKRALATGRSWARVS